MRQHVAVLDACKPVDGRPVESDALFERRVYIRWGNGYILEISQNVDEPKTEKADIALSICLMTYCLVSIIESILPTVVARRGRGAEKGEGDAAPYATKIARIGYTPSR